ncbi:MAG: hypothetical protein L0099_14720 [Acidobacteria bacterium]|nr:hypothetical protein [Acidobacteriota bacterium]
MPTRIVFNGKEYASLDEMPADVRRAYQEVVGLLADADRSAGADFAPDSGGEPKLNITRLRFLHEGKEYSSLEQMPPEARRRYDEAVRQLGDTSRVGSPEMLVGQGTTGSIEENRHIVVRTTQNIRLKGQDTPATLKSLLSSVGASFLAAALAALVTLIILVAWKLL